MKTISSSIDLRLAAYAAAGVALAAPAMTPTAKADIIYSGPLTLNVPTTTVDGIYLNCGHGCVCDSRPGGSPGWDYQPVIFPANFKFLYEPTLPGLARSRIVVAGTVRPLWLIIFRW